MEIGTLFHRLVAAVLNARSAEVLSSVSQWHSEQFYVMTKRTFDDSEDWKYKVLCGCVL